MTVNGHVADNFSLVFDKTDYGVKITLLNNYQLDVTTTNFNELIGFTKKIVTTTEKGANFPNITRSVDDVDVHCSLLSDSRVNGLSSDILHTFSVISLKSGISFKINQHHLLWHKINTKKIERLRIYITDSIGRTLYLNSQPVELRLVLEEY